jgi:uncharacterized MnhB-related membrane protein
MENSKKNINYILLITIVISSIFTNIILTRVILNSLNYDGFFKVLSTISFLHLIAGALTLQKSDNRTIGWALVWSGLTSVLFSLFLTYGIYQLYSV